MVYIHIFIESMWLSWQSLGHTGGLSVAMGYLTHSSPSAWWCQRLIHQFLGWDETQRQPICSSPQGFGTAADETNLINIDREVGRVPLSGCTVGNEVKKQRTKQAFFGSCLCPQAFTKETRKVQERKLENQNWKGCVKWAKKQQMRICRKWETAYDDKPDPNTSMTFLPLPL